MRYFISGCLVLLVATVVLAQGKDEAKEPDWNFKSKSAKSALKKYGSAITSLNKKSNTALTKMQNGYDKEVKAKRLELVMALEKALDTETEKKNLKEAIKIQEAVEAIKEGASPPDAPELLVMGGGGAEAQKGKEPTTKEIPWKTQLRNLLGTWQWFDGHTITFHRNGTVTHSGGNSATWRKEKQRIVMIWKSESRPGIPMWESLNFPIDPKGVTGDGWAGPGCVNTKKVR